MAKLSPTEAQITKLKAIAENGGTTTDIATEFHIGWHVAKRWLTELDIKIEVTQRRKPRPEQHLYGLGINEIQPGEASQMHQARMSELRGDRERISICNQQKAVDSLRV